MAGKLGVAVNDAKTGFNEPTFTAIKGSNSNTKQTTFKGAIDDLISAVNKGMKFQGNDDKAVTVNLDGMLKIVGKGSDANNIDVADNNIKVSKTDAGDGLEIGLSKNLTGIESVGKGDEKIKFSDKKIELMPESGVKVTFAKNGSDGVKAEGLSSVGKDDKTKISFNNANSKNEIEFSVGDTTKYKFSDTGLDLASKKLSNIAKGTESGDAINKEQLAEVVTALGGGASIKGDGSITAPTYTLQNGDTTNKSYNTVGGALDALDKALTKSKQTANTLGDAIITFSDGQNNFTRKNSETDKKVEFTGGTNVTVTLDATTDTKKGKFTVALDENLTGIKSIANDNTKISLTDKK